MNFTNEQYSNIIYSLLIDLNIQSRVRNSLILSAMDGTDEEKIAYWDKLYSEHKALLIAEIKSKNDGFNPDDLLASILK